MDKTMIEINEEAHRRYTQHLAQAMGQTKEMIMRTIWEMGAQVPKDYIKEVDFNE